MGGRHNEITKRGDPSVKDGFMQLFLLMWGLVKDQEKEAKKQ